MQVPAPIKAVFDSVPLKTYPGTQDPSLAQLDFLEDQRFYFSGPSSGPATFTLAVHNLVKINGKYCPSDPLTFAHCLSICQKNNLKLPDGTSTSGNCLFPLLYNASPDQLIPFLIEDTSARILAKETSDSPPVRTIRSVSEIDAAYATRLSLSPLAVVVDLLLDTLFYDLWVCALLTEALTDAIKRIFLVKATLDITSNLFVSQLLHDLPSWRDFHTRHEALFSEYPNVSRNRALILFYKALIDQLKSLVPQLSSYMDSEPLLRPRIASFFVIVDKTLRDTSLHEAVQGELLLSSQAVVEGF